MAAFPSRRTKSQLFFSEESDGERSFLIWRTKRNSYPFCTFFCIRTDGRQQAAYLFLWTFLGEKAIVTC